MERKKKVMIVIIVTLVITALAAVTLLRLLAVRQPEMRHIKSVRLESISRDSVKLRLCIEAFNPNYFDISLKSASLGLLSHSDTIGILRSSGHKKMHAASADSLVFYLSVANTRIGQLMKNTADTLPVMIKGRIDASVFSIDSNVGVEVPLNLPLKDYVYSAISALPFDSFLIIRNTSVDFAGSGRIVVVMDIVFRNPLNLDIELINYPSSITVGNTYTGEGYLLNSLKTGRNKRSADGKFIFVLNGHSPQSAAGLLSGSGTFETNGVLQMRLSGKPIDLPFAFSGKF
ncbi:MAG: hypothetical protein ACM3SM_15840 [Bacteroidota bacterium]